MSVNSINILCSSCKSNPATKIWSILNEHPGYYGDCPTLMCSDCKPSNIFMDYSHDYNFEVDDYYMGFTNQKPI